MLWATELAGGYFFLTPAGQPVSNPEARSYTTHFFYEHKTKVDMHGSQSLGLFCWENAHHCLVGNALILS